MSTLEQLLAASRVFAFREAIVATLRPLFVGCEVKSHLGRLDMQDVEAEQSPFVAPSLNVAVTRVPTALGRLSGYRDQPVEVAIYVVTADQAVGRRGLVLRDELALAVTDGVLAVLEDVELSRWGLADIDPPEDASAQPLFTAKSWDRGTVFHAVTWRQTLYTLGKPILDLDSAVDGAADVRALLPGDPGWTPPGVMPFGGQSL